MNTIAIRKKGKAGAAAVSFIITKMMRHSTCIPVYEMRCLNLTWKEIIMIKYSNYAIKVLGMVLPLRIAHS